MGWKAAVDIGGTFIDLVAVDAASGSVLRAKADTTLGQLSDGMLKALASSGVLDLGELHAEARCRTVHDRRGRGPAGVFLHVQPA